ncbi:MAG: family N-acetyltransferase [Nocardioides sp.]|nr:hypothetical protein [Nocardioides sp.]MCW2736935.1 family N-acetyltransferase [Nocardioides sp.]
MLPEPTPRPRLRPMAMADLDDVTAVLSARNRDDAVRWIEWQERNYAEHDFGLWVVETHAGEFVGDCGLTVEGTPQGRGGLPRDARDAPARLRHRGRHRRTRLGRGTGPRAPRRSDPPGEPAVAGVARKLGMEVERTALVHGAEALVFGMRLARVS